MQFSLKQLLIAVAVLAAILGLLRTCYLGITYSDTAEGVESVSWLPDGATNVSYYKSYSFSAYEFDISEEGFLKWADRWDVRPVNQPVSITRYTRATIALPPLGPNSTEETRKAFDRVEETHTATIRDGYFYEHRQPNGGGVCVAYDRKAKRAYFQSNPR